jgi:hypothetical protein
MSRFSCALVLALSAFAWPAWALVEGKTAQGEPYVTGGVGATEEASLKQRSAEFSLRILVAAAGSGAYLADARVRITDAGGRQVLDVRTDGPWLLVNLKLGAYKVVATVEGQTREQATTIHAGDRHEMVFRFDVPVERLPKGEKQ